MRSERIQRRIDRLLDQADEAADAGEWAAAADLAARVLVIEPDNADAAALSAMSQPTATSGGRGGESSSGQFVASDVADEVREIRDRVVGERRRVTVMYVDAVGFTALAEALDEEHVYGIAQSCLAVMTECVHRHGGTVTQFRGDGIMAVFGAPLALEDSAVKAARAALEMRDRLAVQRDALHARHGADCEFRIGLNTGPVVVGSISDDLQMDFTAIGDTVNLAARLEQSADPGTVWCSAATAEAIAGYVVCEPRPPTRMKGKSQPVPVFEVTALSGAQTRLEAALARGLSGFVGRARELALLQTYLEQRRADQPVSVTVVGDAGAGKSRLVLEAQARAGDDIRWARGQCVASGNDTPLLPLASLVRDWLGIGEAMGESDIRAACDRAVDGWPATVAPYLAFLLDLEVPELAAVDGRVLQAGVTDAIVELLRSHQGTPPVLVIEDVHWIDPVSASVLGRLVDRAVVGFVLVLTERPGYSHALEGWTALGRLVLQQLGAEDVGALAADAAGLNQLTAEAATAIGARAGGNPLFVEELTRSFVEQGLLDAATGEVAAGIGPADLPAPGSIQDVILSRIDRLGEDAKGALQIASVIGREFSVLLLDHLAQNPQLEFSLDLLRTVELIRLASQSPELAFMFKHALTHDVAYRTLLMERRRDLHLEAARAIEEIYKDRLGEFHNELARHYLTAERWAEAVPHLEEAIRKAIRAGAMDAALQLCDQLVEVSGRIGEPDVEASALEMKALTNMRAYGAFGPSPARRAGEAYSELAQLLEQRGEHDSAVQISAMAAWAAVPGHDPERAEELSRRAWEAAETTTVADVAVTAGSARAFVLAAIDGDLIEARLVKDRVADQVGAAHDGVQGLAHMTDLVLGTWLGDYSRGLAAAEAIAPMLEDPFAACDSIAGPRWLEILNLCGAGHYERALARGLATDEYYARVGEVEFRSRLQNSIGWVLYEILDLEGAATWNHRGIALISTLDHGDNEPLANAQLNLADIHIESGQFDEARAMLDAVAPILAEPGLEDFMAWRFSMHWLAGMVRLALGEEDPSLALEHADHLVDRAAASGAGRHEAIGRRLRAEALLGLDDPEAAQAEQNRAVQVADLVGNPNQRWRIHLLGVQIASAAGDRSGAERHLASATSVINAVAAALTPERRATFLAAPIIAQAVAASN